MNDYMTKTDMKFFKKARKVALLSDYKKVHIGCVAVYQGQIIGIGCNLEKTHPIQAHYNIFRNKDISLCSSLLPKLHAEINCLNAIRHMNINFSKVKLYIYRARKDRLIGICKPCPSCMAAIKDLGIKHIYYTTNDGFAYEKICYGEVA